LQPVAPTSKVHTMDLKALCKTLSSFFATRPEVSLAYLFGSVAQGRMNKLSDIDIALLVDENKFKMLDTKEPYGYKAAVLTDLMGLLHTNEIDLVLLHEASSLLANQVISRGKLLFCRDERIRIDFVVRTKHRYIDTKKIREIQAYYLYQRIDSGLFGRLGVHDGRHSKDRRKS
jgi:predicted nucleotidyltransferase